MINGKEFLKKYVDLVRRTQAAQDAFFKAKKEKGYTDRTLLQKSKDLEAELKRATKYYYDHSLQINLDL